MGSCEKYFGAATSKVSRQSLGKLLTTLIPSCLILEMSRQSSVDEDVHSDERVSKLDSYSLQIIDDAFDNAVGWHPNERPGKRRRITRSSAKPSVQSESAGGFLVEDVEIGMDTGGGFIPEPSDEVEPSVDEQPQTIPLSLIPTALASLGLPSDDDEILEVFRNASSGWSGSRGNGAESASSISRRDWRSVCAVLLPNGIPNEGRAADLSDGDPEGDLDFSDVREEEESDLSEEEYQPSSKRPSATKSSKSKGKSQLDSPMSSDEGEDVARTLSSRQKRDCRAAFALFFPDLSSDSAGLDKRRVTIKDVARCAGLLKEKLTAEDVWHICFFILFVNAHALSFSDYRNAPNVLIGRFK